jgi:hypothetical protein
MKPRRAALVVLGLALMATPAAAEVALAINGGRVSLSAKNATVSQILAEWAKVGQTKIVNGERVAGGPVTLELTNVTEVEAIEILLRSAGGYLLAQRPTPMANASSYDRILVLPMSAGPRASATPAPAPAPVRALPQPPNFQQFTPPAPQNGDNGDPAIPPNPGVQNVRPPVFSTFPQQPPPQGTGTPPPGTRGPTVTAPAGVSTPGMTVPVPQQPGSPGPPQ